MGLCLVVEDCVSSTICHGAVSDIFLVASTLEVSLIISERYVELGVVFLLLALSPRDVGLIATYPGATSSSSGGLPRLQGWLTGTLSIVTL